MIDVTLDVEQLCESLGSERIHVPVVACGIGTDTPAAVRAIKAGAKEYVPLPPNAELIAAVLQAVAAEADAIVSRDPAMTTVLALAEQIAPADASVLITGESGTGKELMARHIHKKSRRAKSPFISVNCAAIPDNLLESELFGHEKGAFTGAVARRVGKFEEANGGTLLLDEISEMHPRLQAKLLRAVQEREIDRVGGTRPVPVDIRLLATSNRDLEEEVRAGNFREDLYFRLNVVNIRLPALRERPTDIEPLATHFVDKYAEANGLGSRHLSQEAMERLNAHHWRGNVRELENSMHRAVLAVDGSRNRGRDDPAVRRRDGPRRRGCRRGHAQGLDSGHPRCRRIGTGRPDRGRGRARPDLGDPAAHARQPDARRQHPRHFDPDPAQQAEGVQRRRRRRADARRRPNSRPPSAVPPRQAATDRWPKSPA